MVHGSGKQAHIATRISSKPYETHQISPAKQPIAETIAEYLSLKHWHNPVHQTLQRDTSLYTLQDAFNTDEFNMAEYNAALKSTKNNKQGGPDGIVMELFKWMDTTNRATILQVINQWWTKKSAPDDIFLARVVSIYKKGDSDLPENYRPISLLNSIYKLYMIMIRRRMQDILEQHLCETQYGFRPSRSTSQAIFITRRLQDISEQQGSNMIMVFLDREKAFDRVQHNRLLIALDRIGVHKKFIDVLQDCYSKASFLVEDEYGFSNQKKQTAGIRQGCPLSPYLFVLLMSVIDSDVSFKLQRAHRYRSNNILPIQRVYYADDTILIATNTTAANRTLMEVENVSLQYGLRLNRNKCCYISMNGNNVVKFPDGQVLNRVGEATYLGHQITEGMDVRHEIQHKMVQTLKTWYKLTPFWTTVVCSKKWRLQVYDAIIRNKLLYGLETVHLTQSLQKKVNAFQLRGLRKNWDSTPRTLTARTRTNLSYVKQMKLSV